MHDIRAYRYTCMENQTHRHLYTRKKLRNLLCKGELQPINTASEKRQMKTNG